MRTERLTSNLGLVTTFHEAHAPAGSLVAGENFTIADGAVRLDARYINKAEIGAGSRTARGSGWGKFGSNEEYLMVSDTAMHFCPTPTASTWTAVTGAGSLNASEWYFQQFGQYMYTTNATDGIGRKVIGTNSWGLITIPTAPAAAPGATFVSPNTETVSFAGGSASASAGTVTLSDGNVLWTHTAAGTFTLEITFDTSPDLRPNWQYRDMGFQRMILSAGVTIPELSIEDNSAYIQTLFWFKEPVTGTSWDVWYRWQNVARSSRDVITKLKYTFTTTGAATVRIYCITAAQVWMSIDSNTNPGSGVPALRPLMYEYTYYNSTTGFESAPSPVKTLTAAQQSGLFGNWVTLTAATTAASGVDYIRFYRRVESGGITYRYRLTSVANSGSPSYVDKLPLEEVEALTRFYPSILPTSGIGSITAWQNRLVLGVGTLCYISQEDDELRFEPSTGAYDPFNPSRGLTFYPDDKKGETILALVGQEALYIGTGYSVRAVHGSTPDNWRLMKLPDIEGIVGARAMCAYKKGILALTPSGRLLYHHISLPEPIDLSSNVQARPGESGMTEMATSDAAVSVTPDGEIWVTNQAGRYFIRDVDGRWRRGTFTHGVHSHLFVSGMPIRWIGVNGKLYQGGISTYVTDGGTSGTNGTAVTFSATPARLSFERSRLWWLYFGDATGTAPYPRATVYSQENQVGATYSKGTSRKYKRTAITDRPIGEWAKIKLEGDKDTVFDDFRIDLAPLAPARQK